MTMNTDPLSRSSVKALGLRDRKTNLATALADALRQDIASGRLLPGEKLPTEPSLGETAGVSRTVVREAVAALKAEGLIEIRKGTGAFVLRKPKPVLVPTDWETTSLAEILHILELRLAVEVETAALAATRRTKADLEAMEEAVRSLQMATEQNEDRSAAVSALHYAIARATQNPKMVAFLDYFGEFLFPLRQFDAGKRLLLFTPAQIELANSEQRAVVEAIRIGDSTAAAAAMRSHLIASRKRWQSLV